MEEEEVEVREAGMLCCGSRTNVMPSQLADMAPVRRQSVGLVLTVMTVPSPLNPLTSPPPHRVTDLSVHWPDTDTETLLASWTPPLHQGTTSGYRIVMSHNISELLQPRPDRRETISVNLTDLGLQETSANRVTFSFSPQQPQDFYMGVIGLSDANTPGKISNLVYVSRPQSAKGVVGGQFSSDADLQPSNDSSQSVIILSVCGSMLFILLSLTAGVLYFLRARKKKEMGRRARVVVTAGVGHADDNTDDTSCSSTTHNNSGNNLMPDITSHIQTISRPQHFFSAPAPDTTPTYWSATKLLTEHEQRALAISYCSAAPAITSLYSESLYYPDEDSLSYSSNSKQAESGKEGITNPVFPQQTHQYHGTPVHGLLGNRDQFSPSDEMSDSGSQDDPQAPVRFSTGVQTIAPSAIATLRQNNTYLASLRNRNVSLV